MRLTEDAEVRYRIRERELGIQEQHFVLPALAVFALVLAAYWLLPTADPVKAAPAGSGGANVQQRAVGVVTDTPAITITTTAATSSATPTTSAHEAQIQWLFGTVSGSYSGCTAQAKTSYDGVNFLTFGAPVAVTASTGTLNAWTLVEELGGNSVTTSAVSSSAALGLGQLTQFTFSCTSYGASAPVSVSVIYR